MWISPNRFRELIYFMVTGTRIPRPPIIKIHNRHKHGSNGDLSFPYKIEPWINCIEENPEKHGEADNILTYYKNTKLDNPSSEHWDVDSILTAFKREFVKNCKELFLIDSSVLPMLFEFTLLTNDTVALVFHATRLSHFVIKSVLAEGIYYGHKPARGKRFKITVDHNPLSEVSTLRLNLLKRTIEKMLKSQGHRICERECRTHYVLSTNESLLEKDADFKILIMRCGQALTNNNTTGKMESTLTREEYMNHKIKKIRECYIQRCHEIYVDSHNLERDVGKYACAAMNNELLSIDYFDSVQLESSPIMDSSTREAIYVLYTNVRITSILHKYTKLVIRDEYPPIPEIGELTYFERAGDIATWKMIFDYVLEFPDVLANALYINPKLIVNIPILWRFCYNLCKDFTKYYQSHPVTLTGHYKTQKDIYDATVERLYILKALRIILRNALLVLGIDEITYM